MRNFKFIHSSFVSLNRRMRECLFIYCIKTNINGKKTKFSLNCQLMFKNKALWNPAKVENIFNNLLVLKKNYYNITIYLLG